MAILKCKMCGGDIQAKDGAAFGTCESCGTTSTLPKASDERKANLYNRANHFRRQNDFDKAVQAYENILNDDNADAEAHWGVVLSRYGIEYVEDPVTHQRVPTCHRVQSESILTDADYLETLQHAPDEYTRSLYEEEAKKISEIQKGILAISNKEQPYDVFICYKETTDGGSRTKDSVIAQDIYEQLTKNGCRIFFSRISLEDKLGQQYEPYIFSAINSAKVMLVIGTRKEHFEAVWVKNEWSRFLALKKKDPSRMLIPCYRDMDPYDMPDELANLGLQAQDMGKIGFLQDLIRNVKKMLEEKKAAKTEQAVPVVIPKMFTNVTLEKEKAGLVKRINDTEEYKISLKESLDSRNWDLTSAQDNLRDCRQREREYSEEKRRKKRELESIPEWARNAQDNANIMAAMLYEGANPISESVSWAQQEVSRIQNEISSKRNSIAECDRTLVTLKAQVSDLDALLLKTPEQRTEDYYQRLLDEKKITTDEKKIPELAKKLREMEGYKDTESLATECEGLVFKIQYDRLVQAKNKASNQDEYQELAKQFRGMNGYENSVELAKECDNSAVKARYKQLVQTKNSASTESEYQDLALKFRAMNGYENTIELASECDNQYHVLKQRREEQERIERERRAEQERIEKEQRAEQERIERERREEQERINAKEAAQKSAKEAFGLILQICITIAFFFVLPMLRTITILPQILISVGIPLVFGFISLIFRSYSCPKLPWGVVFLLIIGVVTSVAVGVWQGDNQTFSIISVLIFATPVTLMIFKMNWEYMGWGSRIGSVIGLAIGELIVGMIAQGNSMLMFLFFAVAAIPGIIIIIKAENPDYPPHH